MSLIICSKLLNLRPLSIIGARENETARWKGLGIAPNRIQYPFYEF
jgi:hypothetical protein